MAKIVWTLEAARCLEEIYEYIALDSPTSARSVVNGIYSKVQSLRDQPRLGHRYEPITDREVRELLYGHYRIAYAIKSESQLDVLGIFHGSMDIERHLK